MGLPAVIDDGPVREAGELGRAITVLAAQINTANYRLLKMIAEFELSGGWKCGGTMRTCAHWLVANCGIDMGAAREKVRVARRLAGLPAVEGAFASGDLSYSKVRAITRVATPENEGLLVALADKVTAGHLEKVVSRYQPVPDVELPPAAEDDTVSIGEVNQETAREQGREMFWFQDKDGMWVIHARLPPEQGHLVVKTLEAVARPLQEERQEAYQAAREARVRAAARAIAERHREAGVIAAGENTPDSQADTERVAAESVELERAEEKISAETARRLSCDASLVAVLEDEKGEVLNVGRRSRVVPPHIRRALLERDGVCQFPGCSESRYVDAHHIRHWAEGGETSLDNLVTLCRFHHARLHQGCFEIQVEKVSAETSGALTKLRFVRKRLAG